MNNFYRFEKFSSNIWKVVHRKYGIEASPKLRYEQYYSILGVKNSSDQNSVRRAYIELVKKVHPDSGCPEACELRFKQVNEAFEMLQEKFQYERQDLTQTQTQDDKIEEKDFNIRHTTPQHRAYLTYDGVGSGTPSQRAKEYGKKRAEDAYENVYQYRLKQSTSDETALTVTQSMHEMKSFQMKKKVGIDQMVEDLILEAMTKEDFKKLKGVGKPMEKKHQENPYIDFTTQKLNNILIDNGFTPDWITLQKDIRTSITELKNEMRKDFEIYVENECETKPNRDAVDEFSQKFEYRVNEINTQINRFNLIVPILDKQMFHIKLNQLSENIFKEFELKPFVPRPKSERQVALSNEAGQEPLDFLSFVMQSIFFVNRK